MLTYNDTSTDMPKLTVDELDDLYERCNEYAKMVSVERPFNEKTAGLDNMNMEEWVFSNLKLTDMAKQFFRTEYRNIYGHEACEMNALFGILYASAAGSYDVFLYATPGCSQESRVKGKKRLFMDSGFQLNNCILI